MSMANEYADKERNILKKLREKLVKDVSISKIGSLCLQTRVIRLFKSL